MRAKDLKVSDVFAHGNKLVVKIRPPYKRKMLITYRYRAEGNTGRDIWHPQRLVAVVDPNKEMGSAQLRWITRRGSMKPAPYYVDEMAQTQKLTAEIKKLLK
jgi:hypothetical protein